MKFNIVLQKFQEYSSPRKNITFMQHKFFTCKQRKCQSFDEFVTELDKRSADYEFEQLHDSLICDIIICGINDNRHRKRLLGEPELTLQKVIQLGHATEQTKRHVKELHDGMNFLDNVGKKNTGKEKRIFSKESKFCSYSHNRDNCTGCLKKVSVFDLTKLDKQFHSNRLH